MFSPQSAIARMAYAMKGFWEMGAVYVTQAGRGSTVTKVSDKRKYRHNVDCLCRKIMMLATIGTNRMTFQNFMRQIPEELET